MARWIVVAGVVTFCPLIFASRPAVPDAVLQSYKITPIKHGHSRPDFRHLVIDSGTLYTFTIPGARERLTTPPPINRLVNGTLTKARFGIIDAFDIFQGGGLSVKTGELFYLDKITSAKDGLTFSFASFKLYDFNEPSDIIVQVPMRLNVRVVMTPSQIKAMTPESLHQLTDPAFSPSPQTVDWLADHSD